MIVFSVSVESTPFIFPGLAAAHELTSYDLSVFASSYYVGSILGAAISSLQDTYGRKPFMVLGCAFALCCSTGMLVPGTSYAPLVALRILQSASVQITFNAYMTWFTEFLPTRGRGPFFVALGLGWPVGRAMVIATSALRESNDWEALLILQSSLLAALCAASTLCFESPRYLVISGDVAGAQRVVDRMYLLNGRVRSLPPLTPPLSLVLAPPDGLPTAWQPSKEYVASERTALHAAAKQRAVSEAPLQATAPSGLTARIGVLLHEHGATFALALTIHALLMGVALPLIQVWGPDVLARLLREQVAPHDAVDHLVERHYHSVLSVFNLADFLGVAASIPLADRVGRRGFFTLGFLGGAISFAALADAARLAPWVGDGQPLTAIYVLGSLASFTRGFGPAATLLWTLEAFPTAVRATAFGLTSLTAQASAAVTLPAASIVGLIDPVADIRAYACLLFTLSAVAFVFVHETANAALGDSSSHTVVNEP